MSGLNARSTELMAMIQSEFPDYHPLLSAARIAHNEKASLALQLDCHKLIVKYVETELKSVEVKGEIKTNTVKVSLFELESDCVDADYSEVSQISPRLVDHDRV